MKVGIIGLGFIGQMVGKALLPDHQTIGYTTSFEKIPYLSQFVHEMRSLDFDDLDSLDILIVTVAPKNGASYEKTYLETAKNIVKQHPKWVIYTSSTSVYGSGTVSEESHLLGNQVLIDTETLFMELECTIFRLGGIYGEGRVLKRKVNRIHAKDVVRGICFALDNQLKGVFNLCVPGTDSDKFVLNDKIQLKGFRFEETD